MYEQKLWPCSISHHSYFFFPVDFLLFGIRNSFELTLYCSISDKKIGKSCSNLKYLMLGNFCRTFPTRNFRRVVFDPREEVSRLDPVTRSLPQIWWETLFSVALPPLQPIPGRCQSLFSVHYIHHKTADFHPQSIYFAEANKLN